MPAHSDQLVLDSLAQQTRINRLYTQLVFCFAIHNGDDDGDDGLPSRIHAHLESALKRLCESFPWVAGKTVRRDDIFGIEGFGRNVTVTHRDLRRQSDFPDWDTLSTASFPFKWLDERVVAPCKTLSDESELDSAGLPVFLVQLNIVNGGILLSFNAQHGAIDMAGMAFVIGLFAKACRGVPYGADEIEIGNMDRGNTVPLLTDAEVVDQSRTDAKTEGGSGGQQSNPATTEPSALVWAYFGFSFKSPSSLKSSAMHDVAEANFVSTDDVLSAFIWQAITRARSQRLQKHNWSETSTTLSRNVDMRRYFGLPSTYPGLCVTSSNHTKTIADLVNQSTGAIASQLRWALDPAQLTRQTQIQATLNIKDIRDGTQSNKSTGKSTLEVRLSSWAKEHCYDLDFGELLGKPVAVGRPSFVDGARAGLVYFLPKSLDGEVVVGICLDGDDMRALRDDGEMAEWSVYIG